MRRFNVLAFGLILLAGATSASAATLKSVFVPETLGSTVAYLEKSVGPAWRVQGAQRTYKIGACRLDVTAQRGTIVALDAPVNAGCNPDLGPFFANGPGTPAASLTFGQAARLVSGEFRADCLTMCGNAADPVVYFYVSGFHANGFTDVLLSTEQVANDVLDATQRWEQAMEKAEGQDFVVDGRFNCTLKYQPVAAKALSGVKITHVKVGADLDPTPCDRPR